MTLKELQKTAQSAWNTFCAPDSARVLIGAVTCGRAAGAQAVRAAFEQDLPNASVHASLHDVGCLGMCYAEPLVELSLPGNQRVLYGNVTPDAVPSLIACLEQGDLSHELALATTGEPIEGLPPLEDLPMMKGQVRVVLRNAGWTDPTRLEHYVARDGFSGLDKALAMTPEGVIAEIQASGLRGRGGAGFPTGVKWELTQRATGDTKYVVCNADEGDPGAFMDRAVLESDPFAVLEGLAIAALAVGATEGVMYVRAEYPLAVERITLALHQMESAGLLGDDVLGSGRSLHFGIKEGAGAFVCGEETALLASIEGRRGMPHPRPPYPAEKGLFGKPTSINNVETLANVSAILNKGADWFSAFGTQKSKGTKTFALAGKITHTGLVEVPMGITLKDIVFGIGGGIPNGKAFKAIQTGGPSGGCLPEAMLTMQVDYENLAKAGSIMGSGGMIVMDEDSCMVDIARYFLNFTQNESCGKCTPCRMGSQHLLQILTDICDGHGTATDLDRLRMLSDTVRNGSLCGLGQTLPNPILSTLRYFEAEYTSHVETHYCPAGACKALFHYLVNETTCTACGKCKKACAYGAIEGAKKTPHTITQDACVRCGACYDVCPFDAIEKAKP